MDRPPYPSKARHKWLSEMLLARRMEYLQQLKAEFVRYYAVILDGLINLQGNWSVYEILSDGLGQPEPHWHGIRAWSHPNAFECIPEDELRKLAGEIETRRRTHHWEIGTTHRGLGAYLNEPVLFCVQGEQGSSTDIRVRDVWAFRFDKWHSLNDPECSLPLKGGCTIESIREALGSISASTLWPVFWNESEVNSYLSLVGIFASVSSAEAGVWALHAASDCSAWTPDVVNNTQAALAMTPPMHCLLDVLVSGYERDKTHERRIADVRLFGRCIGKYLPDDCAESFLFDSIGFAAAEIYDRSLSADFLEDYGTVLHYAIDWEKQSHVRLRDFNGPNRDEIPPALATIELVFTAWRVHELVIIADAGATPRMEALLLRAAEDARGAAGRDIQARPLLPGMGERRRHLAAVARLLVAHVDQLRGANQLDYCLRAFRCLFLSSGDESGLPGPRETPSSEDEAASGVESPELRRLGLEPYDAWFLDAALREVGHDG